MSSFTIVVMDVDGETGAEGGGMGSLRLVMSSMVEKLLNVDLSRLEEGDILCQGRQSDPI